MAVSCLSAYVKVREANDFAGAVGLGGASDDVTGPAGFTVEDSMLGISAIAHLV